MNELWQRPEIVLPVHRRFDIFYRTDPPQSSLIIKTVHFRRKLVEAPAGKYWVFECQSCEGPYKHAASVLWVKQNRIAWLYHGCTHPEYKLEPGEWDLRHCWECGNLLSDVDGWPLHTVRVYRGEPIYRLCSDECFNSFAIKQEASVAQLAQQQTCNLPFASSNLAAGSKCQIADERTEGSFYCTRGAGHKGPCAAVPSSGV